MMSVNKISYDASDRRPNSQKHKSIYVYQDDIPKSVLEAGISLNRGVALDTEATGLKSTDRLCLVQLNFGDGIAHLIKIQRNAKPAPNLCGFLENPTVEKLMHYARFDMGILYRTWKILTVSVYCTKIASRFARTYTERHGLKAICRELLGIEISKNEQSSYWGSDQLTEAQKHYAASDVTYLHELRALMDEILEREGKQELVQAANRFLPYRILIDVAGFTEDIFSHTVSKSSD
jgi:ribonuclease D